MSKVSQLGRLYKFKLPDILSGGEGAALPEGYKKFYREWQMTKPLPVHFRPHNKKWIRDENTGEVKRVEDFPIPILHPPESHHGLWGGEALIKGFQKRAKLNARVPHFWVPNLRKTAVYSEVLNQTFSVTATERLIDLIIDHKGFDHYLLQNRACDIQSQMGLKFKQRILHALYYKELYPNDPVKREKVYDKYKHYLSQYTEEEIEWYGLRFEEALERQKKLDAIRNAPKPLKHTYRLQLLQKLTDDLKEDSQRKPEVESKESWLTKINPFSKKQ